MFKNKAMYVRVIDTKTMQPTGEIISQPSDRPIEEMIDSIVSTQGQQIVRSIVTVMIAYFGLKTISTVIINTTNSPRK